MKRILCFGDSLTWGWKPVAHGGPVERYARHERWPGVLEAELGHAAEVIEEGLSGRTTNLDDPGDRRLNGAAYLPAALASHLPLDLVVLMLGTNDTKSFFHRAPLETAVAITGLLGLIAQSAGGVRTVYPAPKVLLVAPPPLGEITAPWLRDIFEGSREKSAALAGYYRSIAEFAGLPFLDAGSVIATEGADGIHFSLQNNLDLGRAVAQRIREGGLV